MSPALRTRAVRLAVDVGVDARAVWVGVAWERRADGLHVSVCLLPCVVVHLLFPPRFARAERGRA